MFNQIWTNQGTQDEGGKDWLVGIQVNVWSDMST
jgi:hypothetical protein